MARYHDLSGIKFGRLTVIEFAGINKSGGAKWNCRCNCGNVKVINAGSLKSGQTKSCGCWHREASKFYHYLGPGIASFNDLFAKYKRGAKKRGYSFTLKKSEFKVLIDKSCHYCGRPPHKTHLSKGDTGITFNGVDRLNNSLGYHKENVVTCCSTCNIAKHTMSYDEFIDWIKLVSSNLNVNK